MPHETDNIQLKGIAVQSSYNILVLGASYGSLFATKSILAGHDVTLVCTQAEVEAINREGTVVILPIRGREQPVRISSNQAPGKLSAITPDEANPPDFDLIVFAMQEPQYASAGIRELMPKIGQSRIPCLAIMNMPPLPYLQRIPGLNTDSLKQCYSSPDTWQDFDPRFITTASPDPQAVRPSLDELNVLQVGLPTNFKAARFASDEATAMLRSIQADIENIRFEINDGAIQLPVKLKVHDSLFVPLTKWQMLLAGNYRCIRRDYMIPIGDAVHGYIDASREIYDWVGDLCIRLGAGKGDLVPFEKYATAATYLKKPSSAARAVFRGATNIERVDFLVQQIARQLGVDTAVIDPIIVTVDERLAINRGES